jgi:hypothetical protein
MVENMGNHDISGIFFTVCENGPVKIVDLAIEKW